MSHPHHNTFNIPDQDCLLCNVKSQLCKHDAGVFYDIFGRLWCGNCGAILSLNRHVPEIDEVTV